MSLPAAVWDRLAAIPLTFLRRNAELWEYTRFAIGGPAAILVQTPDPHALNSALQTLDSLNIPRLVIGGGTNLIVSDSGYPGVVLQFTGAAIHRSGTELRSEAGAVLQDVVDFSIAAGLAGLQTMTGIPGWLGGAVYGNAGAYGRSMHEVVLEVTATDGRQIIQFSNADCRFAYRESIFKSQKQWIILSAVLQLKADDPAALGKTANDIRTVRDQKYPPAMKCAGSIFKNLLFANLPVNVQLQIPPGLVREGKVPSAWFLEQVGVKGLRVGDIHVATYHANLIYNDGAGTAADLLTVIRELKARVHERFDFSLEEEVQYVGFA